MRLGAACANGAAAVDDDGIDGAGGGALSVVNTSRFTSTLGSAGVAPAAWLAGPLSAHTQPHAVTRSNERSERERVTD